MVLNNLKLEASKMNRVNVFSHKSKEDMNNIVISINNEYNEKLLKNLSEVVYKKIIKKFYI